jgi:hypothetical protein
VNVCWFGGYGHMNRGKGERGKKMSRLLLPSPFPLPVCPLLRLPSRDRR